MVDAEREEDECREERCGFVQVGWWQDLRLKTNLRVRGNPEGRPFPERRNPQFIPASAVLRK